MTNRFLILFGQMLTRRLSWLAPNLSSDRNESYKYFGKKLSLLSGTKSSYLLVSQTARALMSGPVLSGGGSSGTSCELLLPGPGGGSGASSTGTNLLGGGILVSSLVGPRSGILR